jgi:TRAP-type transport system small permease protein
MTPFLDIISRILKIAMTALLALLIVPVTMQIVSRYTDLVPRYIWTEEIARFCFIWVIMLGAMVAVREDSHFDVDVLPQPRTRAGQGWARLIVHVPMAFLALCFIYYGKEFADQGAMQTSEIADLPMLAIYIAWPLAGVIWALFLIEKIAGDVRNIRSSD